MRFWTSWTRREPPGADCLDGLPSGAFDDLVWCTGHGDDEVGEYGTTCAVIDALDEADAQALARATDPWYLDERFTKAVPDGWTPPGDRFPAAEEAS